VRLLIWFLLLGLSTVSVLRGHLADALLLAGLKALLVGWEFMELRTASRFHAVGYALYVFVCVGGLVIAAP
jgi:hypothetical protein